MSHDIPAKQRITFEVDTWEFLKAHAKYEDSNNSYRFESLCVDPLSLKSLGLALYGIEVISAEAIPSDPAGHPQTTEDKEEK